MQVNSPGPGPARVHRLFTDPLGMAIPSARNVRRLHPPSCPNLRRRPHPHRRRPQNHPTIPAPDQRQSRTLQPNPHPRTGLQNPLHHQAPTPPSTHRIPRLLQSPPTPQRTRRSTSTTHHHTRQPSVWERQLVANGQLGRSQVPGAPYACWSSCAGSLTDSPTLPSALGRRLGGSNTGIR